MGFFKRMVLSVVASKLERRAQHSNNPMVHSMLREVNHKLGRHGGHPHAGYPHYGPQYHPGPAYHGHYRHHGHYRRRFW
ncbi:hypothetical protein ACTOB_002746 [Actinoplanes oblitus]|uniref:Uncharacterized protein n=1 Tax=Actinoplanes oblitus TaxID=3040509 RepID=A0ABY8WNT5_9ACTN|nr:hypothetical protein [Actinoplanes oblitus]WIM99107.1 hypothetical protein ACTOB_002746 [Actinoplanes oblitus]